MVLTDDVALRSFSAELPSSKKWPGALLRSIFRPIQLPAGTFNAGKSKPSSKIGFTAMNTASSARVEAPRSVVLQVSCCLASSTSCCGRIAGHSWLPPFNCVHHMLPIARMTPTAAGYCLRSQHCHGQSHPCSTKAAH